MKVSIVVPNHNRDIKHLKESINLSTHKNVEFIEINKGLERSVQRNMGILESNGDFILILDSDQSISAGLLEECLYLMDKGYDAIYIPEIIVSKSFFGKIRAFERTFYTGTDIDVVRFVRRTHCPLFDESLVGPEDSDWDNRITGKRAISAHPLYHHDDISLKEYIRKKAYYTKSMRKYAEKWPHCKCLDLKWRCFGVFVENGKWRKILRHPILFCGIIFILLIRGIIYAKK